MKLRILLADDHPIVRSGVRAQLERVVGWTVVGEAGTPDELIEMLEREPCDLLVTDFSMPGRQVGDGLSLLSLIARRWPQLPVVVLTMVSNLGVLRAMLAAGVRGLVAKADALGELPQAVATVQKGRMYVSASLERELKQASVDHGALTRKPVLSQREAEVVRLLASGLTVSEIAAQTSRSAKTISRQKMDAMAKLGLKGDVELYVYARENGLLV